MICPSCQRENRDGRRFCGGCGGPLALVCGACGAVDEDGAHSVELQEVPAAWAYLAEALVGAQDWSGAHDAARNALEGSERCFRLLTEIRALRVLALAQARLSSGQSSEPDQLLDRAERVIETSGARVMTPWIIEARGELAGLRGDDAKRAGLYREARQQYEAMEAFGQAQRLQP